MVWRCREGHSYTMDTSVGERHGDNTHSHNHQPIASRDENSTHTKMEQTQGSAHNQLHTEELDGETEINLFYSLSLNFFKCARKKDESICTSHGVLLYTLMI